MREQPYISVAMGTYNRLEMLKQSVRSIYRSAGDYTVEIIINDGGSDDGTIKWLEDLRDRKNFVKVIFSGELTGITKSYNQAFAMATGKYVTWTSDDIIMEGQGLSNMCDFMKTLGKNDMGAFSLKNDIPGKETKYIVPRYKNLLCPNTGCLNLEHFRELGFWNMDYPDYCQDLELAAQIYRMGGTVKACPEATLFHIYKPDVLRCKNVTNWSKGYGNDKWELVNKLKFGQKTMRKFPRILFLVEDGYNVQRTKIVHTRLTTIYKNVQVVMSSRVPFKEISAVNVFPINDAQKARFDVIFSFSRSGINLLSPNDKKLQRSKLLGIITGNIKKEKKRKKK